MVVISFTNKYNEKIWALQILTNASGEIDIMNTKGNICISDKIAYDWCFYTNDSLYNIKLEEEDNSLNIFGKETILNDLIEINKLKAEETTVWDSENENWIDENVDYFIGQAKRIAEKYGINIDDNPRHFIEDHDWEYATDSIVLDRMGWDICNKTEKHLRKLLEY